MEKAHKVLALPSSPSPLLLCSSGPHLPFPHPPHLPHHSSLSPLSSPLLASPPHSAPSPSAPDFRNCSSKSCRCVRRANGDNRKFRSSCRPSSGASARD